MTSRLPVVALLLGLAAAVASGYGGFEAGVSFVGTAGLNSALTRLNQNPEVGGGSGQFTYKAPMWWIGGHGGSLIGVISIGGSGAASIWQSNADSLGSEMVAVHGEFEVGYPYAPAEYFWVRPYLDVSLASWVIYCHSVEDGVLLGGMEPNISRWYAAWTVGAVPGVEVMGRVRAGATGSVGLFAKAAYFIPVSSHEWYGDDSPPTFSVKGFTLTAGLRFGHLPFRPYRI